MQSTNSQKPKPQSHLNKEIAKALLMPGCGPLHPGLLISTRKIESVRRLGPNERLAIWAAKYYNAGYHRVVGGVG